MSTDDIEDRAATWVVREDGGALSAPARAELDAWLAADPRHLGAFVRAKAAWMRLDRMQSLGVRTPPAPVKTRPLLLNRRAALGVGATAAAGLAIGVVVLRSEQTYESRPGEIRRVQLQDGSTVVMNENARIDVHMSARERRVRLSRGEAWFQVAHNPQRPFIVSAGDLRARAVGTAFSVDAAPERPVLATTEGLVVVTARRGAEAPVPAGVEAVLDDKGRFTITDVGVAALSRRLAWRELRIAFDGDSLTDAVVRFNRYNTRKLVIGSPGLRGVRVVGLFRIDDPGAFAEAVAFTVGAQVRADADHITIFDKPGKDTRT